MNLSKVEMEIKRMRVSDVYKWTLTYSADTFLMGGLISEVRCGNYISVALRGKPKNSRLVMRFNVSYTIICLCL